MGGGRIVRELLSQACTRAEHQRKLQQLPIVFKAAWPVKVAAENSQEHCSSDKDGHKEHFTVTAHQPPPPALQHRPGPHVTGTPRAAPAHQSQHVLPPVFA